jgi:peroxiredoxin
LRRLFVTPNPVAIGAKVPDFELATLDGKSLNVLSFSGKRLVVFCWASW